MMYYSNRCFTNRETEWLNNERIRICRSLIRGSSAETHLCRKPAFCLKTASRSPRICAGTLWVSSCRASRTGAGARCRGSRRGPRDVWRRGLARSCWRPSWTRSRWPIGQRWPRGACAPSRGTCVRRARCSWSRCARLPLQAVFGTLAKSQLQNGCLQFHERVPVSNLKF